MKRIFIVLLFFALSCFTCIAQTYTQVTNIMTPNNSTVQDVYSLTSTDISLTSTQLAALANSIASNYNGAELIDAPSYKYNCHAYAWHVSEGSNKVWIGRYTTTAEDIYWTDGSYLQISENIAAKVSYHQDGNHSAIRLNSTWYQSKWGESALVKHHPNDVPLIYEPSMTKNYYIKSPPISGPSLICPAGATFSVSNLPSVDSIIWSTGPFLNIYSGQNTNSPVIKSTGIGNSWVGVRLVNSFGNFTLQQKIVQAGGYRPEIYDLPSSLCAGSTYVVYGSSSEGGYYYWEVYGGTILGGQGTNCLSFSTNMLVPPNTSGSVGVSLTVTSECNTPITEGVNVPVYECSGGDGMMLVFSPNPTTGETTLTIESTTEEKMVDETVSWELEVYDNVQNLKLKNAKVNGKEYKFNTSGWKEGVYIVRVKYKDEILTGKLVVKQ